MSDNNTPEQEMGPRSVKDVLSSMVDERLEELLKSEENRVLLDGLEQATKRVEMARRELAEIEKQEIEAKKMKEYVNQLETRASEIAECQKEILEARAMVEEAERSLAVDGVGGRDALMENESEAIKKNAERLESIKASLISAIVGTLAGSPISLTQVNSISELILSLAITLISCALYGITYRYVMRRDLEDIHLKSGVAAAFGVVKGLAILGAGPPLELNAGSLLSHAYDGAISVSENLLIFLLATVALDFFIKLKILSPFPIEISD